MTRKDAYAIITERIIAKLEAGTVPWHKPWSGPEGMPANLVSGKAYRGINVFLLGCSGFSSPYWVTFKQAKSLGGCVRKGEKATPIVFWKWIEKKGTDPETGEPRKGRFPFLRYYNVFNATQCDGLKHKRLEPVEGEAKTFDPIAAAGAIIDGFEDKPDIRLGGNRACYSPQLDAINVPEPEFFDGGEHYYSVLFHELTHSTGAEKRLDRPGIADFDRHGSEQYSQEELVAEMGAAFLCGQAGIDTEGLLNNSAAYIASWLEKLQSEPKLVILAAAQAQKAVDHVLGTTFECEEKKAA